MKVVFWGRIEGVGNRRKVVATGVPSLEFEGKEDKTAQANSTPCPEDPKYFGWL